MNRLLVAAALTLAVSVSGHSISATPATASQTATIASSAMPLAHVAPELLANRGGGTGNDVQENQRPSYLG
jgi:hypothetical protein